MDFPTAKNRVLPEGIRLRDELWAVAKKLAPSDEATRIKEIASRVPEIEKAVEARVQEALDSDRVQRVCAEIILETNQRKRWERVKGAVLDALS